LIITVVAVAVFYCFFMLCCIVIVGPLQV